METQCRYFNGYKPCGKSTECNRDCSFRDIAKSRGLIIHLGALGAVARATALLPAIHRKYPGIHLTWITDAPAHHLLKNNPYIDRVLTSSHEDVLSLSALNFDFGFVIDKSLKAAGILKQTQIEMIYGFIADSYTGSIVPATDAASELWRIGLSDELKFHVNKKSEIQLITEALELHWVQDEYQIPLAKAELALAKERRKEWSSHGTKRVIGVNTGCADVIPYKKLTIQKHREIIRQLLSEDRNLRVVLLGGPEDTLRNREIADGLDVIESPTQLGLRDGLVSTLATDIVLTGDSLGMHLAIAMKRIVVAWFGPTCSHEIELYGRGQKLNAPVSCSPCWKRQCNNQDMCYDALSISEVVKAIQNHISLISPRKSDLYLNYDRSF